MGFLDDLSAGVSNFGKRTLQGLGRIPTDEEEANRRREMDLRERDLNSVLEVRQEDILNSRLARKQTMGALAAQSDMAAGWGMTFSQMQARLGAVGAMGQLADANLANQNARAVASDIALQQKFSDPKAFVDYFDGIKAAQSGMTLEDYQAGKRAAVATQNAQAAQTLATQETVSGVMDDIEAIARMKANKPDLELFSRQEHIDGLQLMMDKIGKGASEDEALRAVLQAASKRAASKFMQLTKEPEAGIQAEPAAASDPGNLFPGLPDGLMQFLGVDPAAGMKPSGGLGLTQMLDPRQMGLMRQRSGGL